MLRRGVACMAALVCGLGSAAASAVAAEGATVDAAPVLSPDALALVGDADALSSAAFLKPRDAVWAREDVRPMGGVFVRADRPGAAAGDPFAPMVLTEDGRLLGFRSGETALSGDDRLRVTVAGELRGANGAPAASGRLALDPADAEAFDVTYLRRLPKLSADDGQYALDVTPHAGVSFGSEGSGAEAGATVTFGESEGVEDRLKGLVKDGQAFGETGRWYVFAAASGRAVGYNMLRSRSGDWTRSGMSTDEGSFIGDAQAGLAWRKGDMQASFGYVHREVKAYGEEERDGFVAFQLSIKPE